MTHRGKPSDPQFNRSTTMKKLAIVHHSTHGHTEHIARHVLAGAPGVPGTRAAELLEMTP